MIDSQTPSSFKDIGILKSMGLSKTNISLYDLQGRRLKTLINSMHRPGYYTITLRLNDLQSGIYIVKIISGNATKIRKIALVK